MASIVKDTGVSLSAPTGEAATVEVLDGQGESQVAAAVVCVNPDGSQVAQPLTEAQLKASTGWLAETVEGRTKSASNLFHTGNGEGVEIDLGAAYVIDSLILHGRSEASLGPYVIYGSDNSMTISGVTHREYTDAHCE